MNDTERGLTDVLAHQQADERERALRALLMQPLLADGSVELALVRRHGPYLRDWFARETGWRMYVERGCARLYKTPATTKDATRGLAGFDRERYVLLCLVCAVLERAESQITLRALGERLVEALADPELSSRGLKLDLDRARERRALVQICRYLLALGVLSRVAGDEEAWINRSGDTLYDVRRRVLAAMPASTRGVSQLSGPAAPRTFEERLAALVEEYVPDGTESHRTAVRHRLARRLLDDPVSYYDELTEAEHQYLSSQRGPMAARLGEAVGLVPELRAEGLALIDADGDLSDEQLPATGTDAHATLLLAEYIARAARKDAAGWHSGAELAAYLRQAADEYGHYWRKDAREPGAETALAAQAVARLEALGLVRRREGAVQARPALFRFAIGNAQARAQETLL
jgi:uncharacterized protein (TIGR02678 family)